MKKQEHGASDGQVACVRWNDNSVVTLASNHNAVNPLQSARRRVKSEKAKKVPQPHVVLKYNKGMGGVNVLDRMLASYRPCLRSKKVVVEPVFKQTKHGNCCSVPFLRVGAGMPNARMHNDPPECRTPESITLRAGMPKARNAESRILVYDAYYAFSKVVIVLVYENVCWIHY